MADGAELAVAVLAAGQSRRFGDRDKLAALFHGKPLIEHVCDTLRPLPAARRMIVSTAQGARDVAGFETVENPLASAGMGSSVAMAATKARECGAQALLVVLGDMPLVPMEHFAALVQAATPDKIIASHNGKIAMPPAIFGEAVFAQLTQLSGDAGARTLLAQAQTSPCSPELLIDIDTPETLASLSD